MFDWIRRFALTLAASLIGVGNAACACVASSGSPPTKAHAACDTPRSEPVAHASHASMNHSAEPASHADGDNKNAPDHSRCAHCSLTALGQSASVDNGVVASFAKIYKTTAAALTSAMPDFARSEVAPFDRGRWRAPPAPTPVSLKIRLRN